MVCLLICVYMCIDMYVYIYIYIYTHTCIIVILYHIRLGDHIMLCHPAT